MPTTGCFDVERFAADVLAARRPPDLHRYDIIVIWSSGGKDSEAALSEVVAECLRQGYPLERLVVAHNNLGHEVEWHGTMDLAFRQAERWGLRFIAVRRRDGKLLIDHVAEKGMWPDGKRRWCTSDHKRGPGRALLTALVQEMNLGRTAQILQVYGFRAAESAKRAEKVALPLVHNATASGKAVDPAARRREVWDWYPIAGWSTAQVWQRIHAEQLPYHWAYARGMSRLSCTFCILAGEADLVTAARLQPAKAAHYLQVERKTGHDFKQGLPMRRIVAAAGWDDLPLLAAIGAGQVPPPICPACAADLGGAWPDQIHPVPDDVAAAMYRRGGMACNGSGDGYYQIGA